MSTKQKSAAGTAAPEQTGTDPPAADRPAPRKAAGTARKRRWSVTIPYVPLTTVEAADEAEAWEKFKAKWGIVKSEHAPLIVAITG